MDDGVAKQLKKDAGKSIVIDNNDGTCTGFYIFQPRKDKE